jgi:hypothetical protein
MRSGMSFETALERLENANSVKIADQKSSRTLRSRIGMGSWRLKKRWLLRPDFV